VMHAVSGTMLTARILVTKCTSFCVTILIIDTTIAWYCKKCAAVNKKVIAMMSSLYDQQQQLEIRVDQFKAEVCNKRRK